MDGKRGGPGRPAGMAAAAMLAMAVPASMASAQSGARCAAERGLASQNSDTRTRLTIINETSYPVRVYWLDFDGRRQLFGRIAPGGTYRQSTFASHPWVITDMADNCRQVLFAESRDQTVRFNAAGGGRPTPPRPYDPPPLDGPDTVEPLTEADAGRRIDIDVRQEITIALPSNASTGYYWDGMFATNVRIVGRIAEERPRRAAIGAGGTSLVRLRLLRRGPAEITLMYLPPGGGRSRKTLVYRFQGI